MINKIKKVQCEWKIKVHTEGYSTKVKKNVLEQCFTFGNQTSPFTESVWAMMMGKNLKHDYVIGSKEDDIVCIVTAQSHNILVTQPPILTPWLVHFISNALQEMF